MSDFKALFSFLAYVNLLLINYSGPVFPKLPSLIFHLLDKFYTFLSTGKHRHMKKNQGT